MPVEYYPIVLLLVVVLGFCASQLLISFIAGTRSYHPEKSAPYESGMKPRGSARGRFSVKFFLVAMLFIVFDVEAVFLYPWAVLLKELGWFGLVEMLVFLAILGLGLGYVWRKGGLNWD